MSEVPRLPCSAAVRCAIPLSFVFAAADALMYFPRVHLPPSIMLLATVLRACSAFLSALYILLASSLRLVCLPK